MNGHFSACGIRRFIYFWAHVTSLTCKANVQSIKTCHTWFDIVNFFRLGISHGTKKKMYQCGVMKMAQSCWEQNEWLNRKWESESECRGFKYWCWEEFFTASSLLKSTLLFAICTKTGCSWERCIVWLFIRFNRSRFKRSSINEKRSTVGR